MSPKKAKSAGPQVGTTRSSFLADSRALSEILYNAATTRSQLARSLADPRRDIDDECGYQRRGAISGDDYRELYDRHDIANRVVGVLPAESWLVQPEIVEDDDAEVTTPFEAAWEELSYSAQEKSWYRGQAGSFLWEQLRRVDTLSGIGSYGVLLLGLDDGDDLSQPVAPGTGGNRKLLYLRAFDETTAQISAYEQDVSNPRFGQPLLYNLTFYDPEKRVETGPHLPISTKTVHWSRVVHVADNLGSSEIFGIPRMQPVYNRLYDLRKLYGGSAQMYWFGAFPGLTFETQPELGGDVDVDSTQLKEDIEKYATGLQRWMFLAGVTAKSLAPQVVDPTPQIDAQIKAICIQLGVPKRIFEGSERGELASSQDAVAWHARLAYRQETYLTPRLIAPFIDRLIQVGVLPEPAEYKVVWPSMDSLTDVEQAAVALQRTEAMAKYVGGNVEAILDPANFYTQILGFTQDETEAIIDAVMESEPLTPGFGVEEEGPQDDGQLPTKTNDGNPALSGKTGANA